MSDYHSLEATCQGHKSQIDRLQVELRSYVEIAPRLAVYYQERYLSIWIDHEDLMERSHAFQRS